MERSNKGIYFYNSVDMFGPTLFFHDIKIVKTFDDKPGASLFKKWFNLFAPNGSYADRTFSLKVPVNFNIAPQCKMVDYEKTFSLSYEEVAEKRAKELLIHAQKTNQKITILYSGGIDSTLILCSFLKVCTKKELEDNFLILLNHNSINENPNFYFNYIIKNFKLKSSFDFYNYLGKPGYFVISGENNDQLFGSALFKDYIIMFDKKVFQIEASDENMHTLIHKKIQDEKQSWQLVQIFNKIFNNSPVNLPTVYHRFWWLNFTLKWQSVYMRLLGYTPLENRGNLILEHNYTTFFNTANFQKWAMKNNNELIGDDWLTYKYLCKEVIFKFDKNKDYRDNKAKYGSLHDVVRSKKLSLCFDSNLNFYDDQYPEWIWNNENDFVEN